MKKFSINHKLYRKIYLSIIYETREEAEYGSTNR